VRVADDDGPFGVEQLDTLPTARASRMVTAPSAVTTGAQSVSLTVSGVGALHIGLFWSGTVRGSIKTPGEALGLGGAEVP
jgi:hypothetical protein